MADEIGELADFEPRLFQRAAKRRHGQIRI